MSRADYPPKSRRLSFPDDEKVHDWLPMLLEAYYITDKGIAEGVRLMENRGNRLACAKGCSACCLTHRSIPVYPLELVGISWYATEKIKGPLREALKKRLWGHQKGEPCIFLINGACSIHLMRPMACRQFNVFNKVCEAEEDAYYTRREDVLTPIRKYTEEAFLATMPFYGIQKKSERKRIVKKGLMHTMAKDMQQLSWESLASKMVEYDLKYHA